MKEVILKINEKGQCPICLIKPLTYKRDKKLFCHRCSRDYNLDTGIWEPNFGWNKEYEKSRTSKMADLAMRTNIARPCNVNVDGLHHFICACGENNL